MTQARKTLLHPAHAASYHCVARCVRRSWLCGFDEYLGKSFEHRKSWVEQRILELGGIFACGTYAYAVMSNRYHLVVHMSPSTADDWSAYEVARRWVELYPTGKSDTDQLKIDAILQNEALVKLCRQRLTNLSWLMKSISEPIARRANAEDKVNGRFWQGVSATGASWRERPRHECLGPGCLVSAGRANLATSSANYFETNARCWRR